MLDESAPQNILTKDGQSAEVTLEAENEGAAARLGDGLTFITAALDGDENGQLDSQFLEWMQNGGHLYFREGLHNSLIRAGTLMTMWKAAKRPELHPLIEQIAIETDQISECLRDIDDLLSEKGLCSYVFLQGMAKLSQNEEFVEALRSNVWPKAVAQFEIHPFSENIYPYMQSIMEVGDEEDRRQVHAVAVKTFIQHPESCEVLQTWIMSGRGESASLESLTIIADSLAGVGVDPENFFSVAENSTDAMDRTEKLPKENLNFECCLYKDWAAILELEHKMPGATNILNKRFGIQHPGRYPSQMLMDQIENPPNEGEPFGVVLYPIADYNGAFMQQQQAFEGLRKSTESLCKVAIFECSGKLELISCINAVRKKYGKIHFAIIGGHGFEHGIQFGAYQDRTTGQLEANKYMYAFTSDVMRLNALPIKSAFIAKPVIGLVSCSTGIADGIAHEMSEKYQTKLIAPNQLTTLSSMRVWRNTDGELDLDIEYAQPTAGQQFVDGQQIPE